MNEEVSFWWEDRKQERKTPSLTTGNINARRHNVLSINYSGENFKSIESLFDETELKIVDLKQAGKSFSEIASILKISQEEVTEKIRFVNETYRRIFEEEEIIKYRTIKSERSR